MKSLFNPDSPLMKVLSTVADLMLLNALWLIGCLPVFTIGAATAAMYHVTLRMAVGEEENIFRTYIQGFRSNFKQGTKMFFVLLLPVGVAAVNLLLVILNGASDGWAFNALCGLSVLMVAMICTYAYPLIAKFDNTTMATVKNAIFLAIGNLPYTLLAMVLNLAPLVWMLLDPISFTNQFVWFLLGGFACIAYCNGLIFNKLFNKLLSQLNEELN